MTPNEILDAALKEATERSDTFEITESEILEKLKYVCEIGSNRAGIRLLMSCLLAAIHKPDIDLRKPYTKIGTADAFSGRTYDERYLTHFINDNKLPCNSTTAFLTPAFRNIDQPLTTDVKIVGRPPELYTATIGLLDVVNKGKVTAKDMLTDAVRLLIDHRDNKRRRLTKAVQELRDGKGELPLSSEQIVTLMQQHIECKNSSRLSVLMVAAAYEAAGACLGEAGKTLLSHNAADLQTKALGDIEICLEEDDKVVTAYEMKMKRVIIDDIDNVVQKIAKAPPRIHNYIVITTEPIDPIVSDYAKDIYESTGGIEVAVLDCIGFVRHYLHIFHRKRELFLDSYQELVLEEPDSAVNQPLKEAFLALRKAAESDD